MTPEERVIQYAKVCLGLIAIAILLYVVSRLP